MTDPYQVLGVDRTASEDEIKKAYRTLSRRYHPDANINNPNKEQAEERFKQVQTAYDRIMKERTEGYSSGSYHTGGSGWYNDPFGFGERHSNSTSEADETEMHFRAALNYIYTNHFREALNVLGNMTDRTARWYYLSALANSGLGNNSIAQTHAQTAVNMDPSNSQYRELLMRLENGYDWYAARQRSYGYSPAMSTNSCVNLCIANLICNLCCGGGCIC